MGLTRLIIIISAAHSGALNKKGNGQSVVYGGPTKSSGQAPGFVGCVRPEELWPTVLLATDIPARPAGTVWGRAKPSFWVRPPAKKPLPGPWEVYLVAGPRGPLVFMPAQYTGGPAHKVRVILVCKGKRGLELV